ncbi:hypothetical protein HHK36_019336 [Tetracentron sinense]|uniref:Uncharacterized protein n=1 Tax=Tetracentron sinense TaxID=13715 RepID=A0A834YW23_TETSI|nr:hypothetical protein HHK36_019336 [Tetracentron sinense]
MGISSLFRSLVLVVFITGIFAMQLGFVNSVPEVRKLGRTSPSPPTPIRNTGHNPLPPENSLPTDLHHH